jgi:lipoyl-dependent peroxiredoxin
MMTPTPTTQSALPTISGTSGRWPSILNHQSGKMANFSRSATLEWTGDVVRGSGAVAAGTETFTAAVTFPRIAGEPARTTTPEELLAASHATCFGIGLRSVIGQRGGSASRVRVTATITAEKGGGAIRIRSSHLEGQVEGLANIEASMLPEVARAAEEGCTISAVLRESVAISVDVRSV